ncbi:MAG TPA: MBL fold metallo-hydrolase [Spirochaetia bacterium]|nr:MBL fold metallo-hydrolase [Spirochaetia bacterium]
MKLTFWGTGTSTGVPMVGCDCAVCRSSDPRNRRRRASVLLETDGHHWLIDAGPDFRIQALEARLGDLDGVFLTHAHADHILGLDDLRPLSWKKTVPVWADARTTSHVRAAFPYFFEEGDGKTSRPRLDFREIRPDVPIEVPGLRVRPVPVHHGDATILGFRVGRLAYLTDCNGIPATSLPLLEDLDILILGALRPRPHPTHFSLDEAVAMAAKVGARRTYFTHFSHEVDHSVWAATLAEGLFPAYDGLVLEFEA